MVPWPRWPPARARRSATGTSSAPAADPDGERPPTDWRSHFGGSAWQRLPDGEWYCHLFAREQPDLNWDNPEVRAVLPRHPAVLGRPRRRRVPRRRRARPGQGPGRAPPKPAPPRPRPAAGRDGPAVRPGRGARHLPRLADGLRRVRPAADGRRRDMVTPPAPAPTSTPDPPSSVRSSTSPCSRPHWDADQFAQRHPAVHRGPPRASAAASRGCCPATTSPARHPATRCPAGSPEDVAARRRPEPARSTPRSPRRRARAATLIMLALPGSAYLYQGEELGLLEVADLPRSRCRTRSTSDPTTSSRARRLPGPAAVDRRRPVVRLRRPRAVATATLVVSTVCGGPASRPPGKPPGALPDRPRPPAQASNRRRRRLGRASRSAGGPSPAPE